MLGRFRLKHPDIFFDFPIIHGKAIGKPHPVHHIQGIVKNDSLTAARGIDPLEEHIVRYAFPGKLHGNVPTIPVNDQTLDVTGFSNESGAKKETEHEIFQIPGAREQSDQFVPVHLYGKRNLL
jgi:hypothetical protein